MKKKVAPQPAVSIDSSSEFLAGLLGSASISLDESLFKENNITITAWALNKLRDNALI